MEADAIKTGKNPEWETVHKLPVKIRLVRIMYSNGGKDTRILGC